MVSVNAQLRSFHPVYTWADMDCYLCAFGRRAALHAQIVGKRREIVHLDAEGTDIVVGGRVVELQ